MLRPVLRLWAHHRPTVLLVTHDVDEALVLAGRVLVLADGRIAFGGQVTVPRPRERDHPGLIAPRTRLLAELGVATALFRISHTVEALFSRPGQPARRGSAVAPAGILAGQPQDQGPDVPAGGWQAGLCRAWSLRPSGSR